MNLDPQDVAARRQRARNWATFAALLALVVLMYGISVVRMGGH